MWDRLLDMLLLWAAFRTPYPYLLILGTILLILLLLGTFVPIRNGIFGKLFYIGMLVAVAFGLLQVSNVFEAPEDTSLDGKSFSVRSVSVHGLRLENREQIVPGGIVLLKRTERGHREMVRFMEEAVGRAPVSLKWDEELSGYRVRTAAGTDLSACLLRSGLAKVSPTTNAELQSLQDAARRERLGVWFRTYGDSPVWSCGWLCAVLCLLQGMGYVVFCIAVVYIVQWIQEV